MAARLNHVTLLWAARAAVLIAFAAFLATDFRAAWTHLSTDFPNYYTAAVATRHGESLHNFYDWTWFARQMSYAGIENQLGAYAAQTPLTMLPVMGLSWLTPMAAKRVWLAIDLGLLAAAIVLLARTAEIRPEYVALVLFAGYRSMATNFRFGHYYVFLLFLIAAIAWLFSRRRDSMSGFLAGVTFGLKLYTGPLLLYFAAKRKWRSVFGMLAGVACAGAVAIAWFGWADIADYMTRVLPRALEGGSIEPYNPGGPTLSTLLRRTFVKEPELNPSPPFDAPCMFFFLRTASQFGLTTFAAMGIAARNNGDRCRDFAWFIVLTLLLSTSTASYSFILLLAPVVLLLSDAGLLESAYLVATYIALNLNLQPTWLFPKVWLLLLLFLVTGCKY